MPYISIFFVAKISAPLSAIFFIKTSPILIGDETTVSFNALTTGQILSFGISQDVLHDTILISPFAPFTRTELVTIRVGLVNSFLA